MSKRLFSASIACLLGTVATLTSGCSTDSEFVSDSASNPGLGSIGLSLQLASGATLNSVSYTITGPSRFSRTGTLDVSQSTILTATIGDLPAGSGFSIALDGTTTDGGTHCGGTASFNVTAGMTTAVSVHLTCNEPAHTGSVLVNGVLDVCPTVDGISASPAEVSVGSSLALSATAHDSDGGPTALAYHWTTTGGTLSAADVQNPSLTCTAAGAFTVSVTVTDGNCGDTSSATVTCTGAGGGSGASMDLSKYVRVGRYDLPEPTRTMPPDSTSLLAQEASAVTYDWDTDTLFVVGDGGTSVVQVSKTGALIDSMTLAPGGSPQGTEFYDTEGVSYVGNGKFVLIEERYRQANLFTYVAGATLHRTDVQTVKLGTTIGNIGLEGVTYDPETANFIFVKEKEPEGIFITSIDWAAGTASNGSPTTDESVNLFDPSLVNTADFSDVYALSNLPSLAGDPTFDQLLIISQESGQIVQVDRAGNVKHRLTLVADPGDTLSVPDMTVEGITMDRDRILYTASEDGGGDVNHPQLWVYAPSTAVNQPPTAVTLEGAATSIPENTNTTNPLKLADIFVTDDGIGDNTLSLSGPDAASFQITGTALFLKAGTALNAAMKSNYQITIDVDDATVGATPDASTQYTLTITPAASGPINLAITEAAPWSSGNSPLAADWFEVTNFGTSSVSLVGWKMDDNSNSFAVSVPLNGVTSINPGESVIFIETADSSGLAAAAQSFINLWFGGAAPAGLRIGSYSGSGVGLSTGGDAVNLFDNGGNLQAAISFGASPSGTPLPTFDNSAGLNNAVISNLSVVGQNGAFVAASDSNEIGSPGTVGSGGTAIVGITAVDAQASEAGSDPGVFRFTRTGSTTSPLTVLYTIATGAGQATPDDYTPALSGSQIIPAGAASVDVTITPVDDSIAEGPEQLTLTLSDTGSYDVGPNASATITIADNDSANQAPTAVTLLNTVTSISEAADVSSHVRVADISVTDDGVGTNDLSLSGTDAASFEIVGASLFLKAGTSLSHASKPTLSVTVAVDDPSVGGSPDATTDFTLTVTQAAPSLVISEVAPWSSGNSSLAADWFEVTNTGSTAVDITGWKMDDNSHSFASAVALNGVTSIAPGEAVIFIESADLPTVAAAFKNLWFGSNAQRVPQIGAYEGSGVGLSTTADEVNLFDGSGNLVTGVGFGASPSAAPFATFDNHSGIGGSTIPVPLISTLSASGVNGAFAAPGDANEIGSPGIGNVGRLIISEVASWGSSNSTYAADWFEVTNVGSAAVDMTGWTMDDNSNDVTLSVPIVGVGSVAAGQSVVLIEGNSTTASNFITAWFGGTPPAGFVIGSYSGSGVGLSTSSDAVNLFNASGKHITGVTFGAATNNVTFDNTAGLAAVSTLSVAGVNGAFVAPDGVETGSPGRTR
ncbi:MAG TPA: lamin tail domain-containing protein [Polyangiaceae bacterium]|nr:lamin tail domain-containing protein [Polyangiaceae bacterium]